MFSNLRHSVVFVDAKEIEPDGSIWHSSYAVASSQFDPVLVPYVWFAPLATSDQMLGAIADRINIATVLALAPKLADHLLVHVRGDAGSDGVLIRRSDILRIIEHYQHPENWPADLKHITCDECELYDLLEALNTGEHCLDEQAESEAEREAMDAAWDDGIRADFLHEIEQRAQIEGREQLEALDDGAKGEPGGLRAYFEQCREMAGVEWSEQNGGVYWVDAERVAQWCWATFSHIKAEQDAAWRQSVVGNLEAWKAESERSKVY